MRNGLPRLPAASPPPAQNTRMPQPQSRSARRPALCTSYYSPIPPPLPPKPVLMPRYRHPNSGRSRVSPLAPSFSTSSSTTTASSSGWSRRSPDAPSYTSTQSSSARTAKSYPLSRRGSFDDIVLRPRSRATAHSSKRTRVNTRVNTTPSYVWLSR